MKIVWANGGSALYAHIMETLLKAGRTWQKNTVITLLSRLVEKGLLKRWQYYIWLVVLARLLLPVTLRGV